MARTTKTKPELRSLEPKVSSASQELADRIWAGQSDDLPIGERVTRIVTALNARGFDLDIQLPHDDAERLLNAAKAK